jgi:glutamate-1-semialdehyde aminotransferase
LIVIFTTAYNEYAIRAFKVNSVDYLLKPIDKEQLQAAIEKFKKYFHGMLDAGVYLAPSQFEAGFISTAHTPADIEKTVQAAAQVLRTL